MRKQTNNNWFDWYGYIYFNFFYFFICHMVKIHIHCAFNKEKQSTSGEIVVF